MYIVICLLDIPGIINTLFYMYAEVYTVCMGEDDIYFPVMYMYVSIRTFVVVMRVAVT